MGYHYLMKFKGKYRLLPMLDESTNDIPRDANGEIAEGYDDIYIACQNGNKIFAYGHDVNKKIVLYAYIPSLGCGRNVVKALKEQGIPITNYRETDSEVEFHFLAKDIEHVATLMKAKTIGANISPFSAKNLPKSKNVEIPLEKIQRYKEIISQVERGDLLIIHTITDKFLSSILQRNYRKYDKKFNYKTDMKKCKMSRQTKEYIYFKNMWDEYLSYMDKEIAKFYKQKGQQNAKS